MRLPLCVLLLLAVCAAAAGAHARTAVQTVAVMPFGVYAGQGRPEDVTDVVRDGLRARGYSLLAKDELEAFRIRHRIRRAEFMDRAALRGLGLELGVDAVVMGQADMAAGEAPSATVTAQMVECGDARMVWAGIASASGADYSALLGLGTVRDMDELLGRVVAALLEDMPGRIFVNEPSGPDFAGARAGFRPEVLRGGDRGRLVVELKAASDGLRGVRAYLLDREIPLRPLGDGRFAGEFTAPMVERSYPLRLFAADAWNHLVAVETDAVLTVDNSPPPVSMEFRDTAISPDGDGVRDRILFTAEAGERLHIGGWSVRILDASGKAVRTEQGRGPLPDAFAWDGRDGAGHIVPDGDYGCVLSLTDRAGNTASTRPRRIVVDTAPPDISVDLAPEQDGRVVLHLAGGGDVREWELTLHLPGGAVMARFHGRAAPPATLEARALAGVVPAAYSLEAVDGAGNRLRVERAPLIVRTPDPQEMELEPEEREVWVDDF